MSQSKLSFTYSEDDLRNARQQVARTAEVSRTIGKNGSLIERITVEHEENEGIKEMIKKKIRDEEKERKEKEEREKTLEEKRKIKKDRQKQTSTSYRRFNDKQYFQWSSEEELREVEKRKPKEHRHLERESSDTLADVSTTSSSECELCRLAEKAKIKNKLKKKKNMRSASCQQIKEYRKENEV